MVMTHKLKERAARPISSARMEHGATRRLRRLAHDDWLAAFEHVFEAEPILRSQPRRAQAPGAPHYVVKSFDDGALLTTCKVPSGTPLRAVLSSIEARVGEPCTFLVRAAARSGDLGREVDGGAAVDTVALPRYTTGARVDL